MVVKVYVSGISGNKEVKKRQQRVQMILESKGVPCEVVDITEPGRENDKEFMQKNSKMRAEDSRHPLPPQIFNDEEYCGDYEDFDLSNEIDELEKFLKVPLSPARAEAAAAKAAAMGNGQVNGVAGSREASAERVTETKPEESTESSKTASEDVAETKTELPAVPTETGTEENEEEEEEEGEEEEE